MITPSPDGGTALIVHAHPEPTSFSTAQAHAAREALQLKGYRVEVIDLYERQWNAVLARDEFPSAQGAFKPQREQWNAMKDGTLSTDVGNDLDALLHADLLVLSFPLWWFSVPAILKGWLDRVFVMGSVFGGDLGLFDRAALVGRKAVVLVTTGGSADAFTHDGAFGDVEDFLFHVHRGTLEFVGYTALRPIITYGPAHLDDNQRTKALQEVRRAFHNLDHRPVAASSRSHQRS